MIKLLAAILISSLISLGYCSYIYSKPEAASFELYEYKQYQVKREKQADSFTTALDDFTRQTKESNGKAVMAMLNLPEAIGAKYGDEEIKRFMQLEFSIKQQYLIYIIISAAILIGSLIKLSFIRKKL
jgi:hypothetical protein